MRGVAHEAGLIGYNAGITGEGKDLVDALTRDAAANFVLNMSLGPEANGNPRPGDKPEMDAITQGLKTGRGGKGLIYVLSGSNDGDLSQKKDDPQGLDENLGHFGVIGVSAINNKGKRASYSCSGPNNWVVAPGGDDGGTISSTDVTGDKGSKPHRQG